MNYRLKQRIRLNGLNLKRDNEVCTPYKTEKESNSPLLQRSSNNVTEMLLLAISKLNQKFDNLPLKQNKEQLIFNKEAQKLQVSNQSKNNQKIIKNNLQIHPKDQIVKTDLLSDSKDQLNLKQIKRFLIEITDEILSTGFNLYINQTFSKNQAKAFCSKNILFNIKHLLQKSQNWSDPLDKVQKINTFLKKISMANLKKYPQRALVAASQRIKDVIPTTNLLQSDQYDFLYLNKISITNKYQKNYFSQMMITINKMIQTPFQLIHQNSESTLLDIFKYIMARMAVYSTQQCYKGQQKKIETDKNYQIKESKIIRYSYYVKKLLQVQLFQKLKKQIQQVQVGAEKIISQILDFTKSEKKNIHLSSSNLEKNFAIQVVQKSNQQITYQDTNQLKEDYENYFDQPKIKSKLKNLFLNTKLSSKVKKYSKQQIQSGRFQVKDSTILRILSKWTQELQEKFINPNEKIYKRTQKFKNNSFQFTDLQQLQFHQNQIYTQLFNQFLISKQRCIDQFVKIVEQQNFKHQQFFGKLICDGEYVQNQIANIGTFCSKIQKIAGSYTVSYLNCLINELTMIPLILHQDRMFRQTNQQGKSLYNEQVKQKIRNLNLVTLKIGDLMRGKYSCSQNEFIRFVNILQVFCKQNPKVLKIIRVKNRIESKDNDILINVLFMKKVQCEFQLSINNDMNSQASKQKKINQFNHFLYQISRNSLGPISQLAGIVVQQDPLISQYFSKDYQNLQEKVQFKNQINFEKYNKNFGFDRLQKNVRQLLIFLPFICKNCGKITNDFNKFASLKQKQRVCVNCFIQKLKKTNQLQNDQTLGYDLMRQLWNLINQFNPQKLQKPFNQQDYCKFVKFFDHSNLQLFEDSDKLSRFNPKIPLFGYYVDFNKKDPQFRIFIKQVFNQKIVLFKINQRQRTKKLSKRQNKESKEQLANQISQKKTDILGIYQFKDPKKQKSWVKAIPKNYLLWGDRTFSSFTEQILNEFNKILLSSAEVEFIQKFIQCQNLKNQRIEYQNILEDEINQKFMRDVVKQRRSQININRFAKVNDKIFEKTFSIYKKQALLIKEFRANQAIKFQQDYQDKSWIRQLKNVQILYLSSNKIKDISFLHDLIHLTNLNLQDNLIADLKGIQNLTRLNRLDLSQNLLQEFIAFPCMNQITHLNLSKNKLQKVQFQNALNLIVLDISKNNLDKGQSFQTLQYLTDLDISQNKLQNCNFLQNNRSIVSLKLNNNKIKDIQFVVKMINLSSLNLNVNQIQSIQSLKQLKNLQYLNLEENSITEIECLSNMQRLSFVNISSNKITQIKQLKNLPKLSQIHFNYNKIQTIGNIQNIPSLKKLILNKKGIKSITSLNLAGLQYLDLKANQLQNVQFLKQLPNIEQLILNQNFITNIQPISELKSLKVLSLSFNKIANISCLCAMTNIKELNLNNNKITQVPEEIYKMKSLVELNLSYNQIPYAQSLKACYGLKILSLNGCNIIDLSFFISLIRLTTLNLQFNNIRDLNGLKHLNSLTILRLKNNQIQNIEPISKLMSLNHLQIQFNRIKNIDPLYSLVRCMRFYLESNQIPREKQEQFKNKMRPKGIVAMF